MDRSKDLLVAVLYCAVIAGIGAFIGDVLLSAAIGGGLTLAVIEVGNYSGSKGSGGSGSA